MKNIKKILALVMAASMTFLITACGSAGNTESTGSTENTDSADSSAFNVALVIGVGGQGDGGFNDSLVDGVEAAEKEYGITYQLVEPSEVSELEGDYTDLSASDKYDLIVGGGFDAVEALSKVAAEFPEQKYLFVDGVVEDCENVTSVTFRDNEKTYLIGVMAAMNSETNTIGQVVAMDTPSQNMFVAGYMAGAKSVNPDINVIVKYVGGFTDTNTAKELAVSEQEAGADIIYATAGGAGLGVFNAAADGKFKAIGVDVDQCAIDPDHIMLSSTRKIDVVISNNIKAAIDGKMEGGVKTVGLEDDAMGYTYESSNIKMSEESIAAAEEAKKKIISGEIKVPSTIDEVK